VLNSEGLLRYVDSRCIQRELSEVAGISEEEMDEAAHELLYMRQDSAPPPPAPAPAVLPVSSPSFPPHSSGSRPPYYEHLGGYAMHEFKDYNQYSKRPAVSSGEVIGMTWHTRQLRSNRPQPEPTPRCRKDETTMYITSL